MSKLLTFLIALASIIFAVHSPASAQLAGGLMFPGPGTPASSGGGGGFSMAYASSGGNNSPSTTIGYGTLSYSASATRTIVGIQWFPTNTTDTITGVTVGGVSLTQVSGALVVDTLTGGQFVAADMWISSAALSGSSGAVSVT